jgi:hypothetical protein
MGPKQMSCCGPGWADQGFGVQRHFKAMPTARSSSSQVAIDGCAWWPLIHWQTLVLQTAPSIPMNSAMPCRSRLPDCLLIMSPSYRTTTTADPPFRVPSAGPTAKGATRISPLVRVGAGCAGTSASRSSWRT